MKMEMKMNDLSELYRTEYEARLFNKLLTYKDTVFWICLGFSKNSHDAEDLTQEIYLKAYLKLRSLKNHFLIDKTKETGKKEVVLDILLREQVEKLVTWEKVKKEHGDAVTDKAMAAIVVEELLSLKKHLDDKAKEKKKSK
jgi:hypothetical protein